MEKNMTICILIKPPPDASLKVNFDGATFKDIGKAGLGAVI